MTEIVKTLLKVLEAKLKGHEDDYKWRLRLKKNESLAGEKAISFNDGIVTCLTDLIRILKSELDKNE